MSTEVRKQVLEVARLMYNKNMVNTFEGNISACENNRIYITPSQICKGILEEGMIPVCDLEGKLIEGTYKPSSEIKLHLPIYKDRSDVKAVVHAHSPYATAFAIANKPIESKAYPELIMLFDKIPLAAYGTPSTAEIYADVRNYIMDYDVILLANHGILAVGSDPFDAFFKLEAAESIAKALFLARQLGGEKDLPPDKLMELYDMH
ncbi:MAG: class II aldolase/adducin family protein [Clostridia bacterium]|nr:class II aldolase/adducin family protein [Clostridia bacterium]